MFADKLGGGWSSSTFWMVFGLIGRKVLCVVVKGGSGYTGYWVLGRW